MNDTRPGWNPYIAFPLILLLFLIQGTLFQPAVQFFYDGVAYRDAGLYLAAAIDSWREGGSLIWSIIGLGHHLLNHIEGPLVLLVNNIIPLLTGDLLGFSPAVTHWPNALFVTGSGFFLYKLGERLHSNKFGWLLCFFYIFAPWIGPAARRITGYFATLDGFLEAAILFSTVALIQEPGHRLHRVLAPGLMAVFLFHGLDWPAFSAFITLLIFVNRRAKAVLFTNPWVLLPIAALAFWIGWAAWLYHTTGGWEKTFLFYPFTKSARYAQLEWETILHGAILPLGFILPLAAGGVVTFVMRWRVLNETPRLKNFLIAAAFWTFTTTPVFLISSKHYEYTFVCAIPLAVFAAFFLLGQPNRRALILVALVYGGQLAFLASQEKLFTTRPDQRVLAVAAWLNEERPDLLEEGKRALLPRAKPANVGSYSRGRMEGYVMPTNFPQLGYLSGEGYDAEVLSALVDGYRITGEMAFDWLILTPEILDLPIERSRFFKRLKEDPKIFWSARFRDQWGREIFLGEVKDEGRALGDAPHIAVEPLADIYQEKFDNLTFLLRNTDKVKRY